MNTDQHSPRPPDELLIELGFQRYEALCFVALARFSEATAREISEVADVPRTRVYDAIDQLEADGLVATQDSSPKRFRAIPIDRAIDLLGRRFDRRINHLHDGLNALESAESRPTDTAGIWATTGGDAIDSRTIEFIDAASEELILVVNDGETTSERLLECMATASERGVRVIVGTLTESAADRVRTMVPKATLLDSEVDWLWGPADERFPAAGGPEAVLGRIVIADRSAVLLSSLNGDGEHQREHAFWCDDLGNGLVLVARRLLTRELESPDRVS